MTIKERITKKILSIRGVKAKEPVFKTGETVAPEPLTGTTLKKSLRNHSVALEQEFQARVEEKHKELTQKIKDLTKENSQLKANNTKRKSRDQELRDFVALKANDSVLFKIAVILTMIIVIGAFTAIIVSKVM